MAAPERPEPLVVSPMTVGEAARARVLLREARSAARADDDETAIARLEAVLAIAPRAPRVLCELAHLEARAGHHVDALRYAERGRLLLGTPPSGPSPEPLGMCLEDEGRAHEALDHRDEAIARYEQSLALRPDAAVRRRLDALRAQPVAPQDTVTVADVRVGAGLAHTSDDDALLRVLAVGAAGVDDFTGERIDAATVEPLAELALTLAPYSTAILYRVDDGSVPLATERLVVALREERGFRLLATTVGLVDRADHGHSGGSSLAGVPTLAVEQGYLRIDWEVASRESSMGEAPSPSDETLDCFTTEYSGQVVNAFSALCELGPESPRCQVLPTRTDMSEPPSAQLLCVDELGREVDLEARSDLWQPQAHDLAPFAARVTVSADRSIVVTAERGTPPVAARMPAFSAFLP